MTEWYYQTGSSYEGPVTQQVVQDLHASGQIDDKTLVWSATRGGEWQPLREVGLALPRLTPPALPASQINDAFAWAIVSVPILGFIVEYVIVDSYPQLRVPPLAVFAGYGFAYMALSLLDLEAIRKSGRDDRSFKLLASTLLVPIYLFLRAKATEQRQTHLLAWIAAVVTAVFLSVALNVDLT